MVTRVSRPLSKGLVYLLVLTHIHGMMQSTWSYGGDDRRAQRRFSVRLEEGWDHHYPGQKGFRLSVTEKSLLPGAPKKQVTQVFMSPTSLTTKRSSPLFKPWLSSTGETLGFSYALGQAHTLRVDAEGHITLHHTSSALAADQGSLDHDPSDQDLRDQDLVCKIHTLGLVTVQEAYLNHLIVKAHNTHIVGATHLTRLTYQGPSESVSQKDTGPFHGVVVGPEGRLSVRDLNINGSWVNLGQVHLEGTSTVNLQGHDVLNYNRITAEDTSTWDQVGTLLNHHTLKASSLKMDTQKILNQGTLTGDTLEITGEDMLNQGTLEAAQRLDMTSLKDFENEGHLSAPSLSLTAHTLTHTGTLTGETVNLVSDTLLKMDGDLKATTATLKAHTLEGRGHLKANTLEVTTHEGTFSGHMLAQDPLTLTVTGAFTTTGLLSSKDTLTVNLAPGSTFVNAHHLIATKALFLLGDGHLVNKGTLYGRQALSSSLTTFDNHRLVKSDQRIDLLGGTITNHDTWLAQSMAMKTTSHFINHALQETSQGVTDQDKSSQDASSQDRSREGASSASSSSQESTKAPLTGCVIEKDVIFDTYTWCTALTNHGHMLVGGKIKGKTGTIINKGLWDAASFDLTPRVLTNQGVILGQGQITSHTGVNTGSLKGGMSLRVENTFKNQGTLDLLHLQGAGTFMNEGHLTFTGTQEAPSLLGIKHLENGKAEGSSKAVITFKHLHTEAAHETLFNRDKAKITGEIYRDETSSAAFTNEGLMTLHDFYIGGSKMTNLGTLQSKYLNSCGRFVNAEEATLEAEVGYLSKTFLNEGEASFKNLYAKDTINRGHLTSQDLRLIYEGTQLLNEGCLDLDTLHVSEGLITNASSGKIYISKILRLKPWMRPLKKDIKAPVTLTNHGLIKTTTLESEATSVINGSRGHLEVGEAGTFKHLINEGTLEAVKAKILVEDTFKNTGTLKAHTFHKTSPDLHNEGTLLASHLNLKGTVLNQGQMAGLKSAHLELGAGTLTNTTGGALSLIHLTLTGDKPLITNGGTLSLQNTDQLPATTSFVNQTGAHLSLAGNLFAPDTLRFESLLNAGTASFGWGTYTVKTTHHQGPESVWLVKKGMNYFYTDFTSEGSINSSNGFKFTISPRVQNIGTLRIQGGLRMILTDQQNVADIMAKTRFECLGPVLIEGHRFLTSLTHTTTTFPPHTVLKVQSFKNTHTVTGDTLAIHTTHFENTGPTATDLASIDVTGDLTLVTDTLSSPRGSLRSGGTLDVHVTQGDALLGESVYDATKLFYHSNKASFLSGGDMRLRVKGDFKNTFGTLASRGRMSLSARHLSSVAGLIYSQTGVFIEAHILEIIRRAFRTESHRHENVWYRDCGNWFNSWTERMVDVSYTYSYHETSADSLLQVDNIHGDGDLILDIKDHMTVSGSSVLAQGPMKNKHHQIIDPDHPPFKLTVTQTPAGSKALVKSRHSLQFTTDQLAVSGALESLDIRLKARHTQVTGETGPDRPQEPLLLSLSEMYEAFCNRGLGIDQGEEALRQGTHRYTHRLPHPSSSPSPEKVYVHQRPTSSIPPVLVMDQESLTFILSHLAHLHMDVRHAQGNLYDRLHQNALALNKAVITFEDIEAAVEALVYYQIRQICDEDITTVQKRHEVLDPYLAIPVAAQRKSSPSGTLSGEDKLRVDSDTISLKGATCEADDLHLHARQKFEASAHVERTAF